MAEMTPYQEDIRQLYVQGLNLDALQGHSLLVAGATGLVGACVVDIAMADPHRNLQVFARPLMLLFVDAVETAIIAEGVRYLRIEGAFYCGIGCLFLFYGLYRAIGKPGISVVLTVISLGTRVALAYLLSAIPAVGVVGIWWSVPIGWLLADLAGAFYLTGKIGQDRNMSLKRP